MRKLLVLLAVLTIASMGATACGSDDDGPTVSAPTRDPAVGNTVSAPTPTRIIGPGKSIRDVFVSNLQGPLIVRGLLHVNDGEVRMCETLAESFPPQCGGRFLLVKGLDVEATTGLKTEGSVSWSDQQVEIQGTVEGEVLIAETTP